MIPQEALFRAAEGDYDLVVISLNLKQIDGAAGCARICARSTARARCRSW